MSSNIVSPKKMGAIPSTHEGKEGLQRGLGNRHIQLIAIGGAIASGLFMGSGKTISVSGTSIILTYAIIGFFMFFIMRAMGELLLANLKHRSFSDFCTAYIGHWAGYFISWSYWMTWVVVAIADCIVIAGYLRFWFPDLPAWIPAFSVLGILLVLNLVAVKIFGEMEFWFALIKVVAIVILIAAGAVLVAISHISPTGVQASLAHVIEAGVIFPHGITGFFAGFQIAIFSFGGIELIGTTAAEAKEPHKTIPKAINSVPMRVLIFYVLSLICIISVSSWAGIEADKSPFVRLFVLAGIPAAAGIINLVVITSAMSAANSGVYATSRMLFGLASRGQAWKRFESLSSRSVPLVGLIFSAICMTIGLAILFVIPSVMGAFTILSTISAILYIFVWSMILVAYLIYRRQYPELHAQSNFKMPMGIFMTWASLAFLVFVTALLALEPDTRQALCIMPFWFLALTVLYRRRMRLGFKKKA
ncbi:amino acid permease [Comamonas thiooxydans]|uniref:amino acid permease n=1 Tax=Comamonas thiooxydans TaxID=363952 RepID=UPI00057A8460|nr:amino acid permease [Comamonas thiooxydans]